MYRVNVNWAKVHTIASRDDAERLCQWLADQQAFTVHVTGSAGESGPTLDVIVESNRGLVSYLDMDGEVKLASRNPQGTDRDIVSLWNPKYPELELDQIEVERRDLISPKKCLAILRHFLNTGEPVDLVPWPPEDDDDP